MGVNADWPSRLNDAGYALPWRPTQPPEETTLTSTTLLTGGGKSRRGQPSPQNLYQMTSLAVRFDPEANHPPRRWGGPSGIVDLRPGGARVEEHATQSFR